ncbi:hypothetical protein PVT67_13190 [Gallaecimonas kandeliae]|uniref:hypothetical protein n=1 Tax=Gallaecimonas kandeliae TaxID=3029055 RepID=UPI002649411A|nr:hypothetical protein [Gallaecimonas kandeliae]WKE64617.1 hypothetical protein PVT67_13190 [Gallaecimonas kandeliae]
MEKPQSPVRIALLFGSSMWLLTALAAWMYQLDYLESQEAFASGRQLIVHSSSSGYIPGAVLGTFIGGFYAFALLALRPDKGRNRKAAECVQKVTTYVAVGAVVLIFVGHAWLSNRWEAKAEALGYQPCPPLTLLINRMTYQAWTKNLDLCFDPDVSHIVQRGGPEESKAVEAMLEQRKVN